MSNPVSPISQTPRGRQKRYHRRSSRACDECRLRKCKCDGQNPCGPCRVTGNDCTYDPNSVPVQKPTLRVRELEARLRAARDAIKTLQRSTARNGNPGLSTQLAALEEAVGVSTPVRSSQPTPAPTIHSDEVDHHPLMSMMGTTGRRTMDGTASGTLHGPISVFSFVCRNLELFQTGSTSIANDQEAQHTIATLFNAAMPPRESLSTSNYGGSLPNQEHFMHLLDAAFQHCQPLGRLFYIAELQDTVTHFYQHNPSQRAQTSIHLLPLLHSVLSLCYLFNSERHCYNGCGQESRIAMHHFYMATDHIDDVQDPSTLGVQTLLCLVIFLLNSSRTGKAHKYLSMACSMLVRLGVPSRSDKGVVQHQQAQELRIYSLFLEFDTYLSVLLDLPQMLNIQDRGLHVSGMTTPQSDNGISRTFDSIDEVEIECSKLHIRLMAITAKALEAAFHVADSAESEYGHPTTTMVDEKILQDTDLEFRAWIKRLSPLLARAESTSAFRRFRPRLETTFYLSQLALYFPFLHYLIPSKANKPMFSSQSQVALTCIKIASTTILRFAKLNESGELFPTCWTTVHAIFMAVLCLIFLIAAHEGTSRPGEAWRRAELGIKLLATMRCADRGAQACLNIIKLLIARLKHTVDFDIEHIEATTQRICDMQLSSSEKNAFAPQQLSVPGFVPASQSARNHDHSVSVQDLLISDTTHSASLPSPVRAGNSSLHVTIPHNVIQQQTQLTRTTTPQSVITQQLQQQPPLPFTISSALAMSPTSMASILAADTSSPTSARSHIYDHPTSLATNADGILEQAQMSTHTFDFDLLLEM